MLPWQTGKTADKAAALVSHPVLSLGATRLMELEREVEQEYRPQMLKALQQKVQAEALTIEDQAPRCPRCGQALKYHDRPKVSWMVPRKAVDDGSPVSLRALAITSVGHCWIISG
jgi:hypothetical protein